jgi:hypothetical protein
MHPPAVDWYCRDSRGSNGTVCCSRFSVSEDLIQFNDSEPRPLPPPAQSVNKSPPVPNPLLPRRKCISIVPSIELIASNEGKCAGLLPLLLWRRGLRRGWRLFSDSPRSPGHGRFVPTAFVPPNAPWADNAPLLIEFTMGNVRSKSFCRSIRDRSAFC